MFTKKLGKQLATLMIHTRQAYFVILFLQKYCAKEASRQQYQQHLAGHVPPNMPEKKIRILIITGTPKNSSL